MSNLGKKKSGLKLQLFTPPPETLDEPSSHEVDKPCSSDSSNISCDRIDSTVIVDFGDDKRVLINPDSLEVKQQLGHGQFGVVEKVYHKESRHYFAIKRVPLPQGGNENDRMKLLRDVHILNRTDCVNIIKFYGALIWEGYLWILMELMDCSLKCFYKLAHRIRGTPSEGIQFYRNNQFSIPASCPHVSHDIPLGNCELCYPIPENVLSRMASDIVDALNYLYSIRIIHRDVKPSNILINRLGVIKLCDFGVSGYLIESRAKTFEAGCRPYMAPERINPHGDDKGYDIRSDVWSLGITMLEIATGRYPYSHARNFFEQLKSICGDEAPRLPEGKFSKFFEDFVDQCLIKDPRGRPKYDKLLAHTFLHQGRNLNIRYFTEKFLFDRSDDAQTGFDYDSNDS